MYKSDIGYRIKQFGVRAVAVGGVLLVLAGAAWGGTKLYSKIQENSKNKEDTVMVDTSAYDEQEAKWLEHVKNHNCELSHTDAERLNQIYTKLITLGKGPEGDSLVAELIAHMKGCDECYQQKVTGPAKEDPTGPTGPTESTGPAEEDKDKDKDKDVVVEEKDPPAKQDPTDTTGPTGTTGPTESTGPAETPEEDEEIFDVIIETKPNPLVQEQGGK